MKLYCNIKSGILRKINNEVLLYEPPRDKTNKTACALSEDSDQPGHPPSLIRVMLSAWRKLGSLATHRAPSEDSDQTGRMPRLTWAFAGRKVILLVLSWGGSYFPHASFFQSVQELPHQYFARYWHFAIQLCTYSDKNWILVWKDGLKFKYLQPCFCFVSHLNYKTKETWTAPFIDTSIVQLYTLTKKL